jgi:hypothetical protein
MLTVTRATCPACTFADQNGYWGPSVKGGTHCRTCHRSWTGLTEIHCVLCCEHFSNIGNLDRHKTRTGACIPPASVVDKAGVPFLKVKPSASGPTWVGAVSRPDAGFRSSAEPQGA